MQGAEACLIDVRHSSSRLTSARRTVEARMAGRAADLPGAAHLTLADGVVHLDPATAVFEFASGEAAWELMSRNVGPMKATTAALDPATLAELHREFVEFLERHGLEYDERYLWD